MNWIHLSNNNKKKKICLKLINWFWDHSFQYVEEMNHRTTTTYNYYWVLFGILELFFNGIFWWIIHSDEGGFYPSLKSWKKNYPSQLLLKNHFNLQSESYSNLLGIFEQNFTRRSSFLKPMEFKTLFLSHQFGNRFRQNVCW